MDLSTISRHARFFCCKGSIQRNRTLPATFVVLPANLPEYCPRWRSYLCSPSCVRRQSKRQHGCCEDYRFHCEDHLQVGGRGEPREEIFLHAARDPASCCKVTSRRVYSSRFASAVYFVSCAWPRLTNMPV